MAQAEVTLYTTDGTPITETDTGTAKTFSVGNRILFQMIQLDDAADDGTDTLDVKIQTTIDGTNWIDVVAFEQVLGTASADDSQVAMIQLDGAIDPFDGTDLLSAGMTRNLLGNTYRVVATVVSGSDPAFDFEVTARSL